ncbi:membrane fusion protein MtrC [Methylomonas sp. 2BW1-5-20]|uniref:membrane fusion protein MtrC n=1 Tax=Methylomonas sp. 2BW1-5-20 TaxID=3376686 RepID=UPI00404BF38D
MKTTLQIIAPSASLLIAVLLLNAGAAFAAESASAPPAKIEHPMKEAELTRVQLTPDAERRLGIVVKTVEQRQLSRSRLFGGEITLPAQAGTANGNQSVYALLPSLAPAELVRLAQSQIDADGQVEQAKVQAQAAQQTLNRTEQMRRDKVGTDRAVEDARAQVGLAAAALKTAHARRDLLGPALLDVANRATLWVRVPVYVGDVATLDTRVPASVGELRSTPGKPGLKAVPVSAPPSANPAAATVDLFYEVKNSDAMLRPGQRVGVTIPLRDAGNSVVVPWSAIVYDADGGSWVYQSLDAGIYLRRRVQVIWVENDQAALAGGVQEGVKVVTTGAAELFGTEFGAGK